MLRLQEMLIGVTGSRQESSSKAKRFHLHCCNCSSSGLLLTAPRQIMGHHTVTQGTDSP